MVRVGSASIFVLRRIRLMRERMGAALVPLVGVMQVAVRENGYLVNAEDREGAGYMAGERGALLMGLSTGTISLKLITFTGDVLGYYTSR